MASLVVPAGMSVANDDYQPMLPEIAALLEIAKLKTERQRLKLQRKQLKHASAPPAKVRKAANHRLPSNSKWRTWRGFVLDLQRLEGLLSSTARHSKENLAMLGPDSARTITRVMEGYGLNPRDWPPSRWNPDEQRVYRPKTPH